MTSTEQWNAQTEAKNELELDAETIADLDLPVALADELVGASGTAAKCPTHPQLGGRP